MSINLTDELIAKTKKGKLASAKQVYLDGDQENLQQVGEKTHQLEQSIKDIAASGGASVASAVTYDNATSGMTSVTAQGAIDELAAKDKSQDAALSTKAEKADLQSSVTELKAKDAAQDTEIAKKANSSDVESQMQTEQTRVNAELDKKFDKENVAQELGDAEGKVVSQKVISDEIYKVNLSMSDIVREDTASQYDEIKKNAFYNEKGTVINSSYDDFSICYYRVNEGDRIIVKGLEKGINVAAIALVNEIEADALAVYDISYELTSSISVNRLITIPKGVNYVGLSTLYANNKSLVLYKVTDISRITTNTERIDQNQQTIEEHTEAIDNINTNIDSLESKVETYNTQNNNGIAQNNIELYRGEKLEISDTVNEVYLSLNLTLSKMSNFHISYIPVNENETYLIKGTTSGINIASVVLADDIGSFKKIVHKSLILDKTRVELSITIPSGIKYIVLSETSNTKVRMHVYSKDTSIYAESRIDTLEDTAATLLESVNSNSARLDAIEVKVDEFANKLKDKRLLVIGDSIIAQKYIQTEIKKVLGIDVRTHAKGGIGIIQMVDGDGSGDAPEGYDPDTFGVSTIYKLNTSDVEGVDIIMLVGFYNTRRLAKDNCGDLTDMYPEQDTWYGQMNYAIQRVYEELEKAKNTACKVIICSAHKYGKYPYDDTTAYDDGEILFNATKAIADRHSLFLIDLMHNGGINMYNWNQYQNSSTDYNQNYIPSDGVNNGTNKPFDSLNVAPSASENKKKYITIKNKQGYYQSDGTNWNWTGSALYIWNGDHLHLNSEGGSKLGTYIANQLLLLV